MPCISCVMDSVYPIRPEHDYILSILSSGPTQHTWLEKTEKCCYKRLQLLSRKAMN